ncbi:protein of unknown function [Lachnospiraceae bacterium G41]|nr:protein of unknown function [Lachnospiraceae bacterium G41]
MQNRKILSLLMTFIMLLLTFVPSYEAKAFNTTDKNGNISLSATGDIKINLLVAAIDPTLKSIDNKNYSNGKKTIKASEYLGFSLDDSLKFWIDNFEEISHNTVDFNVVDTVVINEFPKYCSMNSLDNKSFQKIFKKDSFGNGDWWSGIQDPEYKPYDTAWDLDYDYYIDKLNLVKRKNNKEFDMVIMFGIDPLSPCETCMVGSSPSWVNGLCFERDCDNFVIVTPTFSRKDGSIENVGHLAEHMLGYTYGMIDYEPRHTIDGSNYMALNDWQKFSLCELLGTSNSKVYGYGMVHYSPNSENDYDWINYTNEVKYYKDWKNGKNAQIFTPDVYQNDPFYSKYGDPTVNHHRWWFYNMPYEDGRDKDGYYNNWWRYIFNPNYVTGIEADTSYPSGEIKLNVGDSTAVKFKVEDQAYKSFTSDTKVSSAAVEIKDKSILSLSGGKINALKAGKTIVTVKLDGFSVEYTVFVGDKAQQTANVSAFVTRMYNVTLNRDPDPDGLDYWTNNLLEGKLTGAETAKHFILADEFINKNLTYNEFLDVMYAAFFDRPKDDQGYYYWLDQLYNGASKEYVVACFVDSEEFTGICESYGIVRGNLDKTTGTPTSSQGIVPLKVDSKNVDDGQLSGYVEKLYTTILGRASEPAGCDYWKKAIKEGNEMDAAKAASQFFQSKEYKDKNKSDEEFLRDVYAMFFGREPDPEGYNYWLENLKKEKVSRVWLIEAGFGKSDEFRGILQSFGFTILN